MSTQLRIPFPLPEEDRTWVREQKQEMTAEEIADLLALTKEPDWPYPTRDEWPR